MLFNSVIESVVLSICAHNLGHCMFSSANLLLNECQAGLGQQQSGGPPRAIGLPAVRIGSRHGG